ncbi:type I restriction endonuclease subunit R [Nocardioides speluncae]|uniref:type I restriction endonuclease subunit R n=1 Tax=Nocardioides speluncae TaxID=2670337 RepID=UPI000D69E6B1|nr:type I restriction endonuclease subunit R [Nocardioides speluncae]
MTGRDGSEAEWEQVALEALGEHGWTALSGAEIAPGTDDGRASWADLVMPPRLLEAMRQLNPSVPGEYLQQALAEILAPKSQDPSAEDHRIHDVLVGGYRGITYLDADGIEHTPTIRIVGTRPEDNDWLAVNQVTIRSTDVTRRFDLVLYLNGMPVALVELKRAGAAQADLAAAHAQLATYLREFPMAFRFAVVNVISDGIEARYGTPFTPLEHYSPWNVDDDGSPMAPGDAITDTERIGVELEYLVDGVFNQERFLQLLRDFTAYDAGDGALTKRIAKPHQYFAVTKAVGSTIQAVQSNGKAGVVWHTQGSGKSMEMELYTNKVMRDPRLKNPTVVVITDRKELDGQLFGTFARSLLLPENQPIQVRKRSTLRDELSNRTTGGIYFTTLQKFGRTEDERNEGAAHPLLSDRRNIIVIVDEAHRSHYDDLDGYARHLKDALPNATLIAFTGTPISFAERNTREVFGDYIDIYDLSRAVEDGATVPVYFEPRLAKVGLAKKVSDEELDQAADEATMDLDEMERAQIEKSVAVINAVYGAPARLEALALDVVTHWEQRSAAMTKFIEGPGKAMIVGATREICANLYAEIVKLRPDWHDEALDKGKIKVVYSGSAKDQPPISKHVRRESDNKVIKERLRKIDDELQIVIVKDMMLTGYDSPPLHTLYVDRPLKGALLMQTLARVNRTYRGKADGLLVAYAPIAEDLNKALAEYSATDQRERPLGKDVDDAVAAATALITKLDELCAGYDWRAHLPQHHGWMKACRGMTGYLRSPATPGNQVDEGEETLGQRYRKLANQLARAWALCSGAQTLDHLGTEVRFYEEVRVWMAKADAAERQASGKPVPDDVRRLLSQLVADVAAAGGIVDIYDMAGIAKPRLSDLGPDFATKAQKADNPHLAIEALRALLIEESGKASPHNLVRQRAFSERLRELMNKYTNQQLTSAEVIAALIEMAKDIAAEGNRGKQYDPPLDDDELALHDAIAANESAAELMEDDVLAQIARELIEIMRRDVKTDWTVRDDVRAKLRSSIKRLLVKYKYPPDKQQDAIHLVIEQMESMAPRYAA